MIPQHHASFQPLNLGDPVVIQIKFDQPREAFELVDSTDLVLSKTYPLQHNWQLKVRAYHYRGFHGLDGLQRLDSFVV